MNINFTHTPMLSLHNITVSVKTGFRQTNKEILSWFNLNIERGQICAFVWKNGAGKTTTLQTIMGFIKQSDWKIQKNFQKIWYSADNTQLYDHLSAVQHIKLLGKLWWLSSQMIKKQEEKLLKLAGLEEYKEKKVWSYSLGMKKKLWLTLSLIHDPECIVWDEPFNGLDPLARKNIKDCIKILQMEWKTLLFSTHMLSDIQDIATHIAIIHNGKMLEHKSLAEIPDNIEQYFLQKIQ